MVGGGEIWSFGEVKLQFSLNSGPKVIEDFQVLGFVTDDYDVIISPPGSRRLTSNNTTCVAASMQPRGSLTKGEVVTKLSIELANKSPSADESQEMKHNFERAQRKRDAAREKWEKEIRRKKKSEEKSFPNK